VSADRKDFCTVGGFREAAGSFEEVLVERFLAGRMSHRAYARRSFEPSSFLIDHDLLVRGAEGQSILRHGCQLSSPEGGPQVSGVDPGETGTGPAGLFEQFLEFRPDAIVGIGSATCCRPSVMSEKQALCP
jgi:hypothetical protein